MLKDRNFAPESIIFHRSKRFWIAEPVLTINGLETKKEIQRFLPSETNQTKANSIDVLANSKWFDFCLGIF